MTWTLIADTNATNDASGTTLDAAASFNLQTGDVVKIEMKGETGFDSTTITAAATTGAANTVTFDSTEKVSVGGAGVALGYLLAATANATATFRVTLGTACDFRRAIFYHWRPPANSTVTKDGGHANSGSSSTAVDSGNATTSGTDGIATGAYGETSSVGISSPKINGTAATQPASSPAGGQTASWYLAYSSGFTGSASATAGSATDWRAAILALTATPNDTPTVSSTSPSNGDTGVSRTANVSLTYNQNITAGSGSYTIWNVTRDLLHETIAVGSASISSATVTINPTNDFVYGETYALTFPAGIVVASDDSAPCAAITDHVTLAWRAVDATGASPGSGLVVGSSSSFVGAGYVGAGDAAASTLTAAQASFTLTGEVTALKAARMLAAVQASFALSGQAAALPRSRPPLVATQASFTLTGENANLPRSHTLPITVGTFALTGQAAALSRSRPPLTAVQAAFALTGEAAILTRARPPLVAAQASFVLTGEAATFPAARELHAVVGSFTLTGEPAALIKASRLALVQSSFTLTGEPIAFSHSRVPLTAAQASFALTGEDATLTSSAGGHPPLTAAQASFVLTGEPIAFAYERHLTTVQASFVLTGQAATLAGAHRLALSQASFALTGEAMSPRAARIVAPTQAAFVLTGEPVGLSRSRPPAVASQASFALTGEAALFERHLVLALTVATFATSFQPAALNASNGSTEGSGGGGGRGRGRRRYRPGLAA